ncbi:MAG: DUF1579 domain-containing protein [Myxococcales bacterium]|nr:DUF1579 domain-containing protein [Myxococcales bacterium]
MLRLAIIVFTAALVSGAARAQEKKEVAGTSVKAGAAVGDAHKERLLHSIARSAAPDEHHKLLEPLVGGRFVEEHYDSVIFGKPYQGQGVTGYDTRTKKYVSSWVDTWGTWITVEEGQADATGKVLTLTAQDYDVATSKTRPIKFVYNIDSNDHHTMRVYETIEGKETLQMEVEYRKTK